MAKIQYQNIIFATLIYVLLILRFGYDFGGNDQVEILPFASYLNDNSLFQKDLFIESTIATWPNERFFVVQLVRLVPENYWFTWCLALHILTTFLLTAGLYQIASLFIKNKLLAWLAVMLNIVFFYMYSPGGNDLYYNQFIASLAAKAIASWALYYYFKEKHSLSFILLIPTTLIHALVGFHLFFILSAVYFITNISNIKPSIAQYFKFSALYLLAAIPFILLVKYNNDKGSNNLLISNAQYYEAIFSFRHSHHYSPLTFPLKKYIVSVFLLAVSLFALKKHKNVFVFLIVSVAFFISGIINDVFFKDIAVASLQVFKISIWIKFFGAVALVKVIEPYIEKSFFIKFKNYWLATIIIFSLGFTFFYYPEPKIYIESFITNKGDYEKDICLAASNVAHKDALFIFPVNFSKFHYYSKRSSYVSYKAMIRSKKYISEWLPRVNLIYGITTQMPEKGFDIQAKANANFSNIDFAKAQLLKEKGITHLITFKTHQIDNLEVLDENEEYKIYKL